MIVLVVAALVIDHFGWLEVTDNLGLSEGGQRTTTIAEGNVQVHFIDVGQGDAVLILSESRSVLIDAGDRPYGDAVVEYIKRVGLPREKLCLIIASHPHADHIGGMEKVLDEIGTERFIKPQIADEYLPETATFERKMNALQSSDIEVSFAQVGYKFDLGAGAYIEILAPYDCFGNSINNHSVIARLVHGENAFLFTGDVERAGEDDLLFREVELSANVLKVSHHGSRTSTQRGILEAVRRGFTQEDELFAVISVGSPNQHSHPHDETLQRLDATGFTILRTDTHGHVVFESSATGLQLFSENH